MEYQGKKASKMASSSLPLFIKFTDWLDPSCSNWKSLAVSEQWCKN